MKKRVLTIIFLVSILFISTISAEAMEITLSKDNYYQGQLLQAEIIGNFIGELKLENIGIYQGNQVHRTPTPSSNLFKQGTRYYYYAVLSYENESYSLRVEDAEYYDGQQTLETSVEKNFTISSVKTPYLAVDKGFIVATSDFSVTVKSLNGIQQVDAEFEGKTLTKEIGYNLQRKFTFSIDGINGYKESSLKIGEYNIPVFIYGAESGEAPFINETIIEKAKNDSINKENESSEIIKNVTFETATEEQIETCDDIDGKICKAEEVCNGPTSFIKDIICCKGTCEIKQTESSSSSKSWIGGIVLLLLLFGGIYWFYYQTKKKQQKEKTIHEEIKEKTENYQRRMNPIEPQKEVKRGLTKI